ncbi:MAG: hypothetical protein LUO93_06280 [Methanomicrobiales archaeon]|nr:hypothetical protein [Methanomicrobiales archaeon]
MLSIPLDSGTTGAPVTRVFPLPTPSMPVSRGIDAIVFELQEYQVNTIHLRHASQQLDQITVGAAIALQKGDTAGVYRSLEDALFTMREAILTLKLLGIMERNQLPRDVLNHLALIRQIIQEAMSETGTILARRKIGYSSTA